jgi:hypothetical protein
MTMADGFVGDSLTEYLDRFKNEVEKLNVVYHIDNYNDAIELFL